MARRKKSLFNRFLFFLNSIFALLLLLAYILPYIPPKTFPLLSVLSLGMPVLLLINALFLLYWLLFLKRELLLSLIVLAVGFSHISSLYQFNITTTQTPSTDSFRVMSYNVRQFNRLGWIDRARVFTEIQDFVQQEAPDILCFQEYFKADTINFPGYKYKTLPLKTRTLGQAVWSKFPIVNSVSLDFPHTANNAIFVDIVFPRKDTVRVFNMHLESLKIDPSFDKFKTDTGKKWTKRISYSFQKQQDQVNSILEAVQDSPYRVILCGDMNNSAFSYVYRELSATFQDSFKKAGNGFGTTFLMDFIPLRIDVILVDPSFKVENFKNYEVELSDHYPISSDISFKP